MGSGPICAMVWEGRDAVKTGRVLLGATNPLASSPGTIRGDFAIVRPRSINHPFRILTIDLSGRRPKRLPRFRCRRVRPEGDCPVVRQERDPELEVCQPRVGLREIDAESSSNVM